MPFKNITFRPNNIDIYTSDVTTHSDTKSQYIVYGGVIMGNFGINSVEGTIRVVLTDPEVDLLNQLVQSVNARLGNGDAFGK